MRTLLAAPRWILGGAVTIGILLAIALVLVPHPTVTESGPPPVAPASAPEMVEVLLADVIAAQGNAALVQIRAESTRVAPPDLEQLAVEGGAD